MSTDVTTIARPYAEALNRLAREEHAYDAWSTTLAFAASVVSDSRVIDLIDNPDLPDGQKEKALFSVMGDYVSLEGRNFIRLLLSNSRLHVLPEVYRLFELLKDAEQGVLEAQIHTAFPLTEKQCDVLLKHLESKYSRRVNASVHEDAGLIGGVKIVIGDSVIDATVKGQLQKMAFTLQR
ncbi:MAG: F0F1 ATP synthase subunit delta [Pseudomonadota bacterium]|nr:F0F1 ATP synthase subunit delta [Pseudomonadota bacterium]